MGGHDYDGKHGVQTGGHQGEGEQRQYSYQMPFFLISICPSTAYRLLFFFLFQAKIDTVYQHLERTRQIQTLLRTFEARDRYLLEDNLWRVSFWSCVNLLVMLAVAVTQIYTLQRLFDNTKRVCT